MLRIYENKSYHLAWFIALLFILVLNIGDITHAQELSGETDTDSIDFPFKEEKESVAPPEESPEDKMLKDKKERMHPKVEGLLWELQEEYINKGPAAAHEFARKRVLKIEEGDKITVLLFLEAGRTLATINKKLLESYGVEIVKGVDNLIKAKVPIPLITQIADHVEGILYIQLPDTPMPGAYLSEGVSLTEASAYQSAGYTGQGVKVAIIDLGFAGVSSAIANSELPGNVVMVDCIGTGCVPTTFPLETDPHGTGVAEIIHDMAPGAQLYLIKIADRSDLLDAKDYCVSNGIKIINHSVIWANQNFYDGTCYNNNSVCTANDAYANGILWVNAAGNVAERHYEATFTDSDADGWHEVFGSYELISLAANANDTIQIFLTWNAWPTTDQDYDLYLYDISMSEIPSTHYRQTGTDRPTETISYVVPGTGIYYLKIKKYSATTNHHIELYSFNHDLSPHVTSSSLMSPADAAGAMAVSATYQGCWPSGPPEPFSSQGPTNDGWTKPEISGPDGVSNYTYYLEGGFYGTSAASPHVAGAAALILSKNPGYSVSQLWSALTGSAIDMGSSGQDYIYGYGRLNMPDISLAGIVPDFSMAQASEARKTLMKEAYGKLPLYFIQNNGQIDERVIFYEKGNDHATFFTKEGVYLSLVKNQRSEVKSQESENVSHIRARGSELKEAEIIKLTLFKANKNPEIIPSDKQDGKVNYFAGKDPVKWKTNIPTYRSVLYREVYEGIDIRYHGNNHQLEYDVIVKPGADPDMVKFSYEGIEEIRVTEDGDLDIILNGGRIIQKRPYIYQEIDGRRMEVAGKLVLYDREKLSALSYGFDVAAYDENYPLVIDPVLIYSTYLGGSNEDVGSDIAVDTSGNAYITGDTRSLDFPLASPLQGLCGGCENYSDVFVTKIDSSGSNLLYSTYIGGSDWDWGNSIVLDNSGNVYLTGGTHSPDFPLVSPIQRTHALDDAFVAKIDAQGIILYSTYLGGISNDNGLGIAVDNVGNTYITGLTSSSDFPLVSPIQGTCASCGVGYADVFVTKINASGSTLLYSTYLGGSSVDIGEAIAIDSSGSAYITGGTFSSDFPLASPIQGTNRGNWDVFVTKVNTTGSAILYSTYLGGGSEDYGNDIATDISGNVYITGATLSTDFPLISPIQAIPGGYYDAFVTKINTSGDAILYSTYLGGSIGDEGFGIATDTAGNTYITGETHSTDFPLVSASQGVNKGDTDAFISKINAPGDAILYSTYLGGNMIDVGNSITVDSCNNVYITGQTRSTNFPIFYAIQATPMGEFDVFVTKAAFSDTVPPGGSIIIKGGKSWTKTASVVLTLNCTDNIDGTGCEDIWISNDGLFDIEPFEPFFQNKAWVLPPGDGNKMVYARYKDSAGNFSATISDSIKLDTTKPVITGVSDMPDPLRHHLGEVSTISITLSDNMSMTCAAGVAFYDGLDTEIRRIINTLVSCPPEGAEVSFLWDGRDNAGILVLSGTYTYKVQARDQALNWSTIKSGTITVE